MSVTISSGGGGGITIETDPTALKIASNLADLTDVEAAKANLGITGGGGGGGIEGVFYGTTGAIDINIADGYIDPSGTPSPKIVVLNTLGFSTLIGAQEVTTDTINARAVVFQDGTFQTTAAVTESPIVTEIKRRLDAVVSSIGFVDYAPVAGFEDDYTMNVSWVYNGVSMRTPTVLYTLWTEWGFVSANGTKYPATYYDNYGISTTAWMPYESSEWRLYKVETDPISANPIDVKSCVFWMNV
jgi:hypothetical protein